MKLIYVCIVFVSLLILPGSMLSQVHQNWFSIQPGVHAIGNMNSKIIATSSNAIICGNKGTELALDIVLMQYSPEGKLIWSTAFDGPQGKSEVMSAIKINGDYIYIVGSTRSYTSDTDGLILKYNMQGALCWAKTFNGTFNLSDGCSDLTFDNSGNIYICGNSANTPNFPRKNNMFIAKLDTAGHILWEKYYGELEKNDAAMGIAFNSLSNNVIVTGYVTETSSRTATLSYDTSGNLIWAQKYGTGTYQNFGRYVFIAPDGYIYVAGNGDNEDYNYNYRLIKYNSSGDTIWVRNAPYTLMESFLYDAAMDNSENIYLAGGHPGVTTGQDAKVVKFNRSGKLLWERIYDAGNSYTDIVNSIALDNMGNCYIVGSSPDSVFNSNINTVKYSSDGNLIWSRQFNGVDNLEDGGTDIAIFPNNDIIVTGYTKSTDYDFCTIKYSESTSIVSLNEEVKDFYLFNNYPNPFNPSTYIKFQLPQSSFTRVSIYNSLGKEIAVLVNENLKAGAYKVNWNGSGYSSGVYFYKLETEGFTGTKKMLLVK